MTTVINRCGSAIDSVSATGSSFGGALQLTTLAQTSIFLVSVASGAGVILPASAPLGDVVEIYNDPGGNTVQVYPPSGDTIDGQTYAQGAGSSGGKLFRKVASTAWQFIGG